MTPFQIKEIRRTLDRNQEQMAAVFGVHLITWHRWEAGKTKPSKRDQAQLEKLYKKYVTKEAA